MLKLLDDVYVYMNPFSATQIGVYERSICIFPLVFVSAVDADR